jgi:hypothetical protein
MIESPFLAGAGKVVRTVLDDQSGAKKYGSYCTRLAIERFFSVRSSLRQSINDTHKLLSSFFVNLVHEQPVD